MANEPVSTATVAQAPDAKGRRILYAVSTFVIVLIAFSAYYYFSVRQRRQLIQQDHLRLLSTTASNVAATIEALEKNVLNAFDLSKIEELQLDKETQQLLLTRLEQIHGTKGILLYDETKGIAPLDKLEILTRTLKKIGGQNLLVFGIGPRVIDSESQTAEDSMGEKPTSAQLFEVEVEFSDRVLNLLPLDVFDGLFLFRADGKLVLRTEGNDLRIADLPSLEGGAPKGTSLPKNVSPPEGASSKGPAAPDVSWRRTRIGDLKVGTASYGVFSQPLDFPLPLEGENEDSWTLAGVVLQSRIDAQTLIISPTIVLSVLAFLLIGVLGLPYLRLCSIGPGERLQGHEVFVIAISLLIAVSLTSIAILDGFGYLQMSDRVNDRLRRVAEEMVDKINREFLAIDTQLGKFIDDRGAQLQQGRAETDLLGKTNADLSAYPFLELVFWIDEKGKQIEKTSVRSTATALVNDLRHREYFQKALHRRFWPSTLTQKDPKALAGSAATPGFFVESIRSVTTGRVSAIVAKSVVFPSEKSDDDAIADPDSRDDGTWVGKYLVAAIESSLLSAMDPVLPPGTGFAVVDDEGLVLFHSDKNRNLKENIFREVEGATSVRTAVEARTTTTLDAVYRTLPTKFLVRPMAGLPWTLMVFSVKEPLWTRHLEVLSFVIVLLGMYLGALLVLLFWYRITRTQETMSLDVGPARRHWYWPRQESRKDYLRIVLLVFVIFATWIYLLLTGEPEQRMRISFILPLLALAGVFVKLQTGAKRMVGVRGYGVAITLSLLFATLVWSDSQNLEGWWRTLLGFVLLVAIFASLSPTFLYIWLAGLACAVTLEPGESSSLLNGSLAIVFGCGVAGFFLVKVPSRHVAWLFRKHPVSKQIWTWLEREGPGSKRAWRGVYVSSITGILLTLAVIPMFTAYRVIFDEVAYIATKYEQLSLSTMLADRAERLVQRFDGIKLSDERAKAVHAGFLPLAPAGWDLTKADDVIAGAGTGARWTAVESVHDPAHPCTQGEEVAVQPIIRTLRNGFDSLTRHGAEIRVLADGSDLGLEGPPFFSWTIDDDRRMLYLDVCKYRRADSLGMRASATRSLPALIDLSISSPVARFRPDAPLLIAGFLTLFGLVWWVMRSVSQKVFLLYTKLPEPCLMGEAFFDSRYRIELRTDSDAEGAILTSTAIRETSSIEDLAQRTASVDEATITLLDFEEGLDETAVVEKKLRLLEILLADFPSTGKKIVIRSEIDPLYYLTRFDHDHVRPGAEIGTSLARWAAVLENFRLVRGDRGARDREQKICRLKSRYRPNDASGAEPANKARETLARECWATPYLRGLGAELSGDRRIAELEPYRVVEHVYDLAESHYRHLWASCSRGEKLLLYRLSQDGFVNWRMRDTLKRLLRRGLVIAPNGFELMNRSFAVFVLRAERPETIAVWEREAGAGTWSRVRTPLFLLLVVLGVFLFFTQKEGFQQVLGLFTALAGAPTLIRIIGFATERRAPVAPVS